ncbi:hypothetical protein T10_1023 [Trichinella papuae]|uniref:PiggyBac transposable element-derived protein domain-containing protein n=1 Tax=Trichinella papuae TaxID=268474 RepID=A0A0V1M1F1_9BILA|nr:hypothetical protein T10_9037 [Trichinella papuae]KRZ65876.1 hypothetical protein T10_1023 [Trichinella papuae]
MTVLWKPCAICISMIIRKLCKIQQLLEMFRKCCVEAENKEIQSVDKQVIPYKGKPKPKQYLYASVKNEAENLFLMPELLSFQPGNYVMKLRETSSKNRRYKLFCENYFIFLDLQLQLKTIGILSCGMIIANTRHGCTLHSEKELKSKG